MAAACFHLGRYEEGYAWAVKSLQEYPNNIHGLCSFALNAACCTGRLQEARDAVARLRTVDPILRITHLKDHYPTPRPEVRAKIDGVLRDLGLPE